MPSADLANAENRAINSVVNTEAESGRIWRVFRSVIQAAHVYPRNVASLRRSTSTHNGYSLPHVSFEQAARDGSGTHRKQDRRDDGRLFDRRYRRI